MRIEKIFVFSRMNSVIKKNHNLVSASAYSNLCFSWSISLLATTPAAASYTYIRVQDIDINKPIFQ